MNSQIALKSFDSALSIMAAAASLTKRANTLTWNYSSFATFDQLLNAKGDYSPSFSRSIPDMLELGILYDAAQQARGDNRRAYMYGSPGRKNSIIDRKNWDSGESYYRIDNRVAFWDRYTKQWICYTVEQETRYQDGAADFYCNAADLLMGEYAHA